MLHKECIPPERQQQLLGAAVGGHVLVVVLEKEQKNRRNEFVNLRESLEPVHRELFHNALVPDYMDL